MNAVTQITRPPTEQTQGVSEEIDRLPIPQQMTSDLGSTAGRFSSPGSDVQEEGSRAGVSNLVKPVYNTITLVFQKSMFHLRRPLGYAKPYQQSVL